MSAMAQMVLPSLAGRRVVVTGGASGIGRCLVEAFLAQGCTVDAIDFDAAAADALRAANPDARLAVRLADLADPAARAAAMQAVADAGRIDVMVNQRRRRHASCVVGRHAGILAAHAGDQSRPPVLLRAGRRARDDGAGIGRHRHASVPSRRVAARPRWRAISWRRAGSRRWCADLPANWGRRACVSSASCRVRSIPSASARLWQTPERVEQILATQAIRQRLDGWDVAQMVLFLASDNARGCTAQSYVVDAGLT